ncbi:MAG: response regulator [Bacteroidetes bacterium]|nr:response regulator [Bacteroidota bacterium]
MAHILWVDDEIAFLKPQILFLEQKGMSVNTATGGEDALDMLQEEAYDLVFLDENMPGLSGLETLDRIKQVYPHLPVVMITKSEEEHVMEDAIGAKIADYLIKPVNPNQVLLSIKKLMEGKELVSQKTTRSYQREFTRLSMRFGEQLDAQEWAEVYQKLVFWDMELQQSEDKGMQEVLNSQFQEANVNFGKYIARHYAHWVKAPAAERPLLSPDVMRSQVLPRLSADRPTYFLLIDCMRYDQWRTLLPLLQPHWTLVEEQSYFAILPTATQYARNALFAGLFPDEIAKKYPQYWVYDDEDRGKNLYEQELMAEQLRQSRLDIAWSYTKVLTETDMKQWADGLHNSLGNTLNCVVINFIDMLAHARSEMAIIKQLAPNEAAVRSLSKSWFQHSPLLPALQLLAQKGARLVITTDHGVVRVKRPLKIVGDRDTSTNLRYKQGRNLNYDPKDRHILGFRNPGDIRLPASNVSSSYAFALEDGYFVYPNNYNHYVNLYADSLQHGGISMEEMIVPLAVLESRGR